MKLPANLLEKGRLEGRQVKSSDNMTDNKKINKKLKKR